MVKISLAVRERIVEQEKEKYMFTPVINWPVYLTACGIIAALYYVLVLFRYYRQELFKPGKKILPPLQDQSALFLQAHDEMKKTVTDRQQIELTYTVHDLVDELRASLQQLASQASGKDDLLKSVFRLFEKYPALKGSGFQQPLTNLVAAESESHCNIRLTADELAGLWS